MLSIIFESWSNKEKSIMRIRTITLTIVLLILAFIFSGCTPRQLQIEGPTPIPTLIPATMPSVALEPTESAPQVVEGYPAGKPDAESGRVLYDEHCAECHGVDGNGVVPNARNFGDVDYMRGETPASFYVVISEGRGQDMPAFGEALSSDERWDVTYYVWNFSTTAENINQGQDIYAANCVSCHGEDGRSMILGAANFSDSRFMTNQSPSDLYIVITQGKGSMPAWQARLEQEERWNSIDYIYTLSYVPKLSDEVALSSPVPEPTQANRPECAAYQTKTNPNDWDDTEAISAGETVYSECISCHGSEGTGAIPGIIDFSSPAFQAELGDESYLHYCAVTEGLNAMPSFKARLNEEQIWQVLTYIGTFGN